MGQSMQTIKRRIRSIGSTMKITKAMELVATSKLQKQKQLMEQNKEFTNHLYKTISRILAVCQDSDHVFLNKRNFDQPLTLIFTGDTGLCGGYHANLFRFIEENVDSKNPMMMVGQKGMAWAKRCNYNVIKEYGEFADISVACADQIAQDIIDMYLDGEISSIQVVYTEFVNSVVFEPRIMKLLPIENIDDKLNQEVLFEPSPEEILDEIIPMYINSMIYSTSLRAKTSEYASRRMAMENATDNGEELTNELLLQYNQARQASITQEITEIIAGAEAL